MLEPVEGARKDLVVLHVAPHLDQGGAERMLHLITSAQRPGLRHRIVLMEEKVFYERGSLAIQNLGFSLDSRWSAFARLPAAIRQLRQIVRDLKPDVIQGWLYYGCVLTLALRDFKIPILWSIHNTTLAPWRKNGILHLADVTLARTSGFAPRKILYCADEARTFHERRGYNPDRSVVVPNGVDTLLFRPDPEVRQAMRLRVGLKEHETAVGVYVRNDPQKDLPTAIAAFAAFASSRPARLLLAGRGMTAQSQLPKLAEAAGVADRVVYMGPIPDLPALLQATDLVLLSSSYGEAMPMVLLEALSVGVPVVSTRVGDIARLPIPDACMAEIGDITGLAGGLAAAVRPDTQALWRTAFARTRETYGFEQCLARYADIYRELASSAGSE